MNPFERQGPTPGSGPKQKRPATPVDRRREAVIASVRKLIDEDRISDAAAALDPLRSSAKKDAEVLYLMATICQRKHDRKGAEELARQSLALRDNAGPNLILAACARLRGETETALAFCDRALSITPGRADARLIKGGVLEEAGRYEEARAIVGPLIEESRSRGGPDHPGLLFEWSKLLVHEKKYHEAVALIDRIVTATTNDKLMRAALSLKAKACDRRSDYRGAFEAASAANAIGRLEYEPDLHAEQVSMLIDNWSREKMKKFPVSQCNSDLPVFVAGMPRSGTSLIDQIIDAHPKAAGVGELATIDKFALELTSAWDPEKEPPASFGRFDSWRWTRTAEAYVKEIKGLAPPGVQRIVNKSLGNNRLVGLIARLFPKTRIIHAIRDPRDVAVSCFQGDFNNDLLPWTTRYEWIARAWEQSHRMMEHWKKSLDVPILDVHYEKLVKHPETEFPRIIEFLGLEWDEACTKFHESKRTVRTLSYDQVNRPLYTSSAGRNANYAPFMEGIVFPPYDPRV